MAKYLYVSTDKGEAKHIIGHFDPNQLKYHEIDMESGEHLSARIGFNPISSIEFNDSVPDRRLEAVAVKFAKEGLFAALESGKIIKQYRPSDIELREWRFLRHFNELGGY